MSEQKPPMPEPRPQIILPEMPITLDRSDRYGNGFMRFTFSDTTVTVSDVNDKDIGEVRGVIGGGLQLHYGSESFYLSAETIWKVFQKAVEEQWLGNPKEDQLTQPSDAEVTKSQ